jgi:hypothetical protein
MFRALLAQPQEVLHKPHLVYCVRVTSISCTRVGGEVSIIKCSFSGGATQATLGILHAWCLLAATRVGVEVSNITCSSSEGATQATLRILRTCYVSWLLPEFGVERGAS